MAQTVSEVLTAATDSVTVINDINDNGIEDMDQADINDMVQRNVDHIEIVLAYEPDPENESDNTPDVAGDSSDKSSYTDAIATGQAYIDAN